MRKNGYFYHVPRTGGHSTYKWFEKLSRKGLTRLWNDGHSTFKSKAQIAKKFGPKAKKRDNIVLEAKDLITVTWLRDPVMHSVSTYTYIKTHGGSKKWKNFKDGMSFSDWIRRKGSPGNFVKFFAPGDGKLETAIRNLETVDFIGYTDNFNNDMNRLMKVFGLDQFKYNNRKINATSGKFKPSKEDVLLLKKLRSADYDLTNEFRKRSGLPLYK